MTFNEAVTGLRENFGISGGSTIQEVTGTITNSGRETISGPMHLDSENLQQNTSFTGSFVYRAIPSEVLSAIKNHYNGEFNASIHLIYQNTCKRASHLNSGIERHRGDWQGYSQELDTIERFKPGNTIITTATVQSGSTRTNTMSPLYFANLTDLYKAGGGREKTGSLSNEVSHIDPNSGYGTLTGTHNDVGWRYATITNGGECRRISRTTNPPWFHSYDGSIYTASVGYGPSYDIQTNPETTYSDPNREMDDYYITHGGAFSGNTNKLKQFAKNFMAKNKLGRFNYCYGLVIYKKTTMNNAVRYIPSVVIYSPMAVIEERDVQDISVTKASMTITLPPGTYSTTYNVQGYRESRFEIKYSTIRVNSIRYLAVDGGGIPVGIGTVPSNYIHVDSNSKTITFDANQIGDFSPYHGTVIDITFLP